MSKKRKPNWFCALGWFAFWLCIENMLDGRFYLLGIPSFIGTTGYWIFVGELELN